MAESLNELINKKELKLSERITVLRNLAALEMEAGLDGPSWPLYLELLTLVEDMLKFEIGEHRPYSAGFVCVHKVFGENP